MRLSEFCQVNGAAASRIVAGHLECERWGVERLGPAIPHGCPEGRQAGQPGVLSRPEHGIHCRSSAILTRLPALE
jgi:hypothetical protein